MNLWTQQKAIGFCRFIESICPQYGCHVALTGGLLYKDGPREDCDILLYRIRQANIDFDGLIAHLKLHGLTNVCEYGFVSKAQWNGYRIDIFRPEVQDGKYERDHPEVAFDGAPEL